VTIDQRFAELWTDLLEGELDAAGLAELEALLASDPRLLAEAADLYEDHRLLGFALQDSPGVGDAFVRATMARVRSGGDAFVASVMDRVRPAPTPTLRPTGFGWRALAASAAGLILGVIATSAAWALSVSRTPEPETQTVLDDGFEFGPAPLAVGVPKEPDVWAGDFSTIVGPTQGVTPASGDRMLQILRADYEGKPNSAGSYVGDLFRIVDLRSRRGEIAGGDAVLEFSAMFNAVIPGNEKYRCTVGVYAMSGDVPSNPALLAISSLHLNALAMARKSRQQIDPDPRSWQRCETELRIPGETDFVLVHVGVAHVGRLQARESFGGHFVDDVRINLTRRKSGSN